MATPKQPSKKTPAKSAAKKTETISGGGSGQKPVSFKKGGLHESTGTPAGKPIPAAKMAAAKRGDLGPKVQKQANFATGMLAAGRETAAKNTSKKAPKGQ